MMMNGRWYIACLARADEALVVQEEELHNKR